MKSIYLIPFFLIFQSCVSQNKPTNEALPQTQQESSDLSFKGYDKQNDQIITLDEYSAQMAIIYGQMISDEKSAPDIKNCLKKYCKNLDKNKDGKINPQEFFRATLMTYKKADLNHNGQLDTDEFKNLINQDLAQ